MGQPWGLSSLEFSGLFALGLAVAAGLPLLMRNLVIRGPLRARTGEPDLHLIGYLRGGADRVAEMIIVDLVESGVLRLASEGKLAITCPAADPLGESARLRVTLAGGGVSPVSTGTAALLSVALGGFGGVPDRPVREALQAGLPPARPTPRDGKIIE